MSERDLIKRLQKLADNWPIDYWIFCNGQALCLMKKKYGKRVMKGESVDPDSVVASFPKIEAEGGDW